MHHKIAEIDDDDCVRSMGLFLSARIERKSGLGLFNMIIRSMNKKRFDLFLEFQLRDYYILHPKIDFVDCITCMPIIVVCAV